MVDVSTEEIIMGIIKDFIKWFTTPTLTSGLPAPLTEGKTRGSTKKPNIKVPPQRPISDPPARSGVLSWGTTKCDWIEVYLPNANNPPTIEHHDKVVFWKDEHGDLFIRDELKNPTVYHRYIKYVYRR
jgi:hypothetical protein